MIDWDLFAREGLLLGGFTEAAATEFVDMVEAATVKQRLALVDEIVCSETVPSYLIPATHVGNADPQIVASLKLALDKSPVVRNAVVRRIAQAGKPLYWPLLVPLLTDPDPAVRRFAIETLGLIHPLDADPPFGRKKMTSWTIGRKIQIMLSPEADDAVKDQLAFELLGEASEPRAAAPAPAARTAAGAAGGAAAPERAADVTVDLPERVVRRHTDLGFRPRPDDPAAGEVTFALRVDQSVTSAGAVDIRIPAGAPHAMLRVQAVCAVFETSPEANVIKVPRDGDSQAARFTVRATKPAEGEVTLYIYDAVRLVGSLEMRLRAYDDAGRLRLERVGQEIFRDPAQSAVRPPIGQTVIAAWDGRPDSKIRYFKMVPPQDGSGLGAEPQRRFIGESERRFEPKAFSSGLDVFRKDIETIVENIERPQTLGVATTDEAYAGLADKLHAAGQHIADDLISPELRDFMGQLPDGSVVNLVLESRDLDAVPWELAWEERTDVHLGARLLIARVPAGRRTTADPARESAGPGIASGTGKPTTPRRFLYVLGEGVVKPKDFPGTCARLREVVKSASGKYDVTSNFDDREITFRNCGWLKKEAADCDIVHLLCHGIADRDDPPYLRLADGNLSHLKASDLAVFRFTRRPVIFVNACSSASAGFTMTGLTTFGWEFTRAGAGAYIGTLAPVLTATALRFATAFFDAFAGAGQAIPDAIMAARRSLATEKDPTRLLYALYADLHEPVTA